MAHAGIIPAGIYIHVPFCVRKCPYCDFYSIADRTRMDEYVDALIREMSGRGKSTPEADTIYFGGGTPSLLSPGAIGRIVDAVHRFFKVATGAEVTLEVNPGTVNTQILSDFRNAGINRINMGIQSFFDETLDFLGRIHDARESKASLVAADRAGFENIGMDLICGIPGRTLKDWQKELKAAFSFLPAHLSCYMLSIEPNTPLYSAMKSGRFKPVSEDLASDIFCATMEAAEHFGYDHYEVSNFAKKAAFRSRHNVKYWIGAPYAGLGPSAHSFIDGIRFWNVCSVDKYITSLFSGLSPIEACERPNAEQQLIEAVYLGLRMGDGIDIEDFKNRFSRSLARRLAGETEILTRHGLLLKRDGTRICLTREGMLKVDAVADWLLGRI